jgi:transcriptional regulator NrdR family protein
MADLKVVKKDGSIEDFDIKKIIKSCEAAGLSEKTAKKVAEKVTKELYKIESSHIRELVLKYLKKEDPELAKAMIQYDINKKKEQEEMREEFIV